MRNRMFSIAVVLCVAMVVWLAVVTLTGPAKGIEAPGNAEDLLAAVRLGCETAASRVSTSTGQVTVHEWYWRSNGELIETDAVYTVASLGDKFKGVAEVHYVKNEASVPESDSRQQSIAPGTVLKQQLAYDGEKVTSYNPAEQCARIAGLDSQAGRDLTMMKLTVMNPGHGVPSLPTGSPSPHYITSSGPYVVGREVVNGDECIVVELVDMVIDVNGDEVAYHNRSWINPQRGFTISKSQSSARGGMFGEGDLVAQAGVETRQYADDLWGISEARTEQYALDSSGTRYLQRRNITTFADDYQLNAPVTEEMLTIQLPSGTKVHNELIDAEYTVP